MIERIYPPMQITPEALEEVEEKFWVECMREKLIANCTVGDMPMPLLWQIERTAYAKANFTTIEHFLR